MPRYAPDQYQNVLRAQGARFIRASKDGQAHLFKLRNGKWAVARRSGNAVNVSIHANESDCGCGD